MRKKVQVIIYITGLGGNILRFLLSLHNNTYPLYPKELWNNNKPRHEMYSFTNIEEEYESWADYECSTQWNKPPTNKTLDEFLANDEYDTLTVADNPDCIDLENFRRPNIDVSLLTIDVSEKYEPMIQEFLKANQNDIEYFDLLGTVKDTRQRKLMDIYRKDYNPYSFNFDCFMEGEESFIKEYKKLLIHLRYKHDETVLQDAVTLYRGWHDARMAKLPEKTSI